MRRKDSRVVSERDPSSPGLAAEILLSGGFVVAPTDTIYGLLADALNHEAVVRLKGLRRPSGKPFLVLVPDLHWVRKLGLKANEIELRLLTTPGLTVVLRKEGRLYHWLGSETVAVRLPRRGFVLKLLRALERPVVAPSANPEGGVPARNIKEAVRYFGDRVYLYVDGGTVEGRPSTLVKLEGEELRVLRRGLLNALGLKKVLERIILPRSGKGHTRVGDL